MNNTEKTQHPNFPWKSMIQLILILPLMLAVLLLSAGRWDWWEAWAYTGFGPADFTWQPDCSAFEVPGSGAGKVFGP